ncbi:MAG: lycopene cyclase domain-containing protein [Longimicrobiales bacterium]
MIPDSYVWLVWSSAFLVPWLGLYAAFPQHRRAMLLASLFTMPFGLTEPLFVPEYWNPPSLFGLAQRTGFDIESLIFCFGIGGVGAVLVNVLTGRVVEPLPEEDRHHHRHRFHRWVVFSPFVVFLVLLPLPWNAIYPGIAAMLVGAALTVWCRPDLTRAVLMGSAVFVAYYAVFLVGLEVTAPGYVERVWNLDDLSGIQLGFMPLEELLFALGFGGYWAGVYEHLSWGRATPAPTAESGHIH